MTQEALDRWKEKGGYSTTLFERDLADKARLKEERENEDRGWFSKAWDWSKSVVTGDNSISIKDIKKDEGYLKAARIFYEHVNGKGSSKGVSDKAIADRFTKFLRIDKNNTSMAIANLARFANAPQEVKDAIAFGKDAFDLAKVTWGGTLKAAALTIADPLNLIGGGLAANLAFKAGGKFFVKQGIKFAAKGAFKNLGYKQTFKQAGRIAYMQSTRKALSSGMTREAANLVGRKAYKGMVRKGIVTGMKYGFYENAATSLIDAAVREGADYSLGRSREYNWGRTISTAATATIFGGILGGGGDVLAPAFKRGFKRAQAAGFFNASTPSSPGPTLGFFGGFWSRGGGSGTRGGPSPTRRAAARAAATTGPTTSTGLELPAYDRKIDWMKVWLRRTANPFKLFTNWAPVTNMDMECRALVRPVFQTIDKILGEVSPTTSISKRADIADTSVLKRLQKLEDDILADVDTNGGAGVDGLINGFSTANSATLASMSSDLKLLRDHIDSEFITVDELNQGKWWAENPTKSIFHMYMNAINSGAHHKTGVTADKKRVLISYIEEYIELTDELQKGVTGKYGQQMKQSVADIQAKKFSTRDIRESVTRLSRAHFLANESETGLTGRWARSDDAANRQWIEKRARSVQDEYFNDEFYSGTPIKEKLVRDENLEKPWQNQLMTYFERIGTKDEKGNITSVVWSYPGNVQPFVAQLTNMYKGGYGNEANFTIKQLARLRQIKGNPEIETIPSSKLIKDAFENTSDYKNNPHLRKWVDEMIEAIDREEIAAKGAIDPVWYISPVEPRARAHMQYYQAHKYPFEFSERWAGTGSMAKPGRIYWRRLLRDVPLAKAWYWLLGAQKADIVNDPAHGSVKLDHVWRGEGESWINVPRRVLVRIASLGLLNDVRKTAWGVKIPWWLPLGIPEFTTLGKYAAIGGGIWAVGAGSEYAFGENGVSSFVAGTGETITRAATYYQREAYDVALGDDEEYNILPFLDEDSSDAEGAQPEGPEADVPGSGRTPRDARRRRRDSDAAAEDDAEEAPAVRTPAIHDGRDASDYFKIDASGQSESDWDFFNNYAAGTSSRSGGSQNSSGLTNALSTGGNMLSSVKDNFLMPLFNMIKGTWNNNPTGAGMLASVAALLIGGRVFKGQGMLGTLATAAITFFAFFFGQSSSPAYAQGSTNHIAASTDQNYRRVGNVRLPSDVHTVRATSHTGSTSSIYLNNDGIDAYTSIDDEETTGGSGDGRGMGVEDRSSTAAAFTSVANESQASDMQQNALLTAMSDEDGGGLVSGFTAVQGGGRYGDISAARDFSGAASFTVYNNQGTDGFVPEDISEEDPFNYMDVADTHEATASVVTMDLAKDEIIGGPPHSPNNTFAGQSVRAGMNV